MPAAGDGSAACGDSFQSVRDGCPKPAGPGRHRRKWAAPASRRESGAERRLARVGCKKKGISKCRPGGSDPEGGNSPDSGAERNRSAVIQGSTDGAGRHCRATPTPVRRVGLGRGAVAVRLVQELHACRRGRAGSRWRTGRRPRPGLRDHAALRTGLENAGLCPALLRGAPPSARRLSGSWAVAVVNENPMPAVRASTRSGGAGVPESAASAACRRCRPAGPWWRA